MLEIPGGGTLKSLKACDKWGLLMLFIRGKGKRKVVRAGTIIKIVIFRND